MDAQLCGHTTHHGTVHFQWVNHILIKLFLQKRKNLQALENFSSSAVHNSLKLETTEVFNRKQIVVYSYNEILNRNENEQSIAILTIQRNPTNTMVNERSQTLKGTNCIIPFIESAETSKTNPC